MGRRHREPALSQRRSGNINASVAANWASTQDCRYRSAKSLGCGVLTFNCHISISVSNSVREPLNQGRTIPSLRAQRMTCYEGVIEVMGRR